MNNFVTVLLTSVIVFILYRFVIACLSSLIIKLCSKGKNSNKGEKYSFMESVIFYILFLGIYVQSIDIASKKYNFSNLDWYLCYSIIGISSIIWCYIEWNIHHIKFRPKLADDTNSKKKKILIFSLVGIYTLWMGYEKINSAVNGTQINFNFDITQTCIVATIIAFDRVLNQIHSLIKDKRKKIEEEKIDNSK